MLHEREDGKHHGLRTGETTSQVGGGDVVALDERTLLVDDLVDTIVRVEVGLNVIEESDRSIGTSATADGSATCVVKQDAVM